MSEAPAAEAPKKSQAAPKKPEESPAQRAARTRRERLAQVLKALRDEPPPYALPPHGAAFFASHLEVELGLDELAKLSVKEVRERAAAFRAKHPQVWGACVRGNALQLATVLKASGLRDASEETAALAAEYQHAAGQLLAS